MALLALAMLAAADASAGAPSVVADSRTAMGTRVQIMVFALDGPPARDAIKAAFAEIDRIEQLMSEWIPESDVSRITAAAGKSPVNISKDTLRVLTYGAEVSRLSGGAFAMTWAALAGLWDFRPADVYRLPDPLVLAERVKRVDDGKLVLDPTAHTAVLREPGMAIGLGAIAKGYAVDRALVILRERGYVHALVNAGGDIAAAGQKGNKPWVVGIQDPGAPGYFATLALRDEAVATSGNYERYFTIGGKRYHHILNPRTGMPAAGVRSVSIVAKDCMSADALATAVFVLGPQEGMALGEAQPGVGVVIVDAAGAVTVSPGLRERVHVVRPPTPEKAETGQ